MESSNVRQVLMMKKRSLYWVMVIFVAAIMAWYFLTPAEYQCEWTRIDKSRSPSGQKVALVFQRACSNGGSTTIATDNVFLLNSALESNFRPSEDDPHLVQSKETSMYPPVVAWEGDNISIKDHE
jgi:capsule polysaccharide export protein KpsE/RkpR